MIYSFLVVVGVNEAVAKQKSQSGSANDDIVVEDVTNAAIYLMHIDRI